MAERLEVGDIQGLVARGYGTLAAACYVLLRVADAGAARAWLGALAGDLTSAESRPDATAVNVAFTRAGLERLGVGAATLSAFAPQFVEGLAQPHRSRILGDDGDSAPERWRWGGPGTPSVDLVLMLFAADGASLDGLYDAHAGRLAGAGIEQLARLDTTYLGGREHFGFRDGVSQPTIDGLSRQDRPANTVQPGEFVLGYRNEYDVAAEPIAVPAGTNRAGALAGVGGDLGRNGSYLVFRQLEQDVAGFWRTVDALTRDAGGGSDPAARTRLAAKMVGRWPSGASLALAPDHDNPARADANDFAYHQQDPDGLACPIGSHVRRTNPRDSLEPKPGSKQSVAAANHHRLLRRGRSYGPPLAIPEIFDANAGTAAQERGLHFICLVGDIARQFEFVQHTWVNNPKFGGLYDDGDPLMAPHGDTGATFSEQAEPVVRRHGGLPRFVAVRGGAYFFLPGIRAVRYLAALGG